MANETVQGADSGATDTDEPTLNIAALLEKNCPPDELPSGWVMRRSRHNSSICYYYNQDSGISRWDPPRPVTEAAAPPPASSIGSMVSHKGSAATGRSILKRAAENEKSAGYSPEGLPEGGRPSPPQKQQRTEPDRSVGTRSSSSSVGGSRKPEQVRVLHILKKHRDSRRPNSWRNPNITDSKEKATADLNELIDILKEQSEGDPKKLRSAFQELAKTESDCSSAKRGGDLGYFGRKKMQPAFEKASFGLRVGELSGIVDTSSGVHVILRLG